MKGAAHFGCICNLQHMSLASVTLSADISHELVTDKNVILLVS